MQGEGDDDRADATSAKEGKRGGGQADGGEGGELRHGYGEREQKRGKMESNPLRSLGDALKEFQRRVSRTRDKDSPEEEDEAAAAPQDEAQSAMPEAEFDPRGSEQALAPATEEQANKQGDIDEKKAIEESSEDAEAPLDDAQDAKEDKQGARKPAVQHASSRMDVEADDEDAAKQNAASDEEAPDVAVPSLGAMEGVAPMEESEEEEDADADNQQRGAPLDVRSAEELRAALELELAQWRSDGQRVTEGERLWREFTTITASFATDLCEQLRLLLLPKRATQLMGDFRTGKRINMKRVIPYIASDFKKDKIWLRRKRPNKRSYQIMVAIDDSRSMRDHRKVSALLFSERRKSHIFIFLIVLDVPFFLHLQSQRPKWFPCCNFSVAAGSNGARVAEHYLRGVVEA